MKLQIHQSGRTYKIYRETKENLVYSGQWFSTLRKGLQVEVNDSNNEICLTICVDNKKIIQWAWNIVYQLNLIKQNKIYKLKCVKYKEQHWQLLTELGKYDYYEHLGHLKSVFKDDKQVAKVEKAYFKTFEKDFICIEYDSGENELILLGILLAFDMGQDNGGSTFSLEFGNIGINQKKQSDKDWRPK